MLYLIPPSITPASDPCPIDDCLTICYKKCPLNAVGCRYPSVSGNSPTAIPETDEEE